jgi:hypothetical protein
VALDASEVRTPDAPGERELRRELRRPQMLAIVVGAIVSAGIYIRPASIAQALGCPKCRCAPPSCSPGPSLT